MNENSKDQNRNIKNDVVLSGHVEGDTTELGHI